MADLILFPTRLFEKYNIQETFGDPTNPQTQKLLRAQVDEMFKQFPNFDGLVVRIGETYLQDAPYHKGSIHNKQNAETTIIPLMQLLREEICVKRKKQLIFRTWWAFDVDLNTYTKVSESVEPHKNLVLAIKHCEGDFFRSNPFSKVIGEGRHRQIIEVQCAREYEGKGAYPNYIAHGVIEGFEEHAGLPEGRINSIREFTEKKPELFAGIWTWTRGGGWDGPYIKNEMWCDLNAWVMTQWARDTSQSEEAVFNRYAKERLGLKGDDNIKAFRRLCILSADAVVRGRYSTHRDMDTGWTRDHCIGWPATPKKEIARKRNLRQKDESIVMWKEVVTLAERIQWPDAKTRNHAIGSSYYSLRLYDIYRSLVYLSDAEYRKDEEAMKQWIQVYDTAWAAYKKLPAQYPELATLYDQNYARYTRPTAHSVVNKLRARLAAARANRGVKYHAWEAQTEPIYQEPDSDLVKDPSVHVSKDGIFYMFYTGSCYGFQGGTFPWRIDYATSPDGLTWTKQGTSFISGEKDVVMAPSRPVWYDGKYYMYYGLGTVESKEGHCASAKELMIGCATSTDLKKWTKQPQRVYHTNKSKANDPFVYQEGDTFFLFYNTYPGGREKIFYRTSSDLESWSEPVDSQAWGEGTVVWKEGDTYYLIAAIGGSASGETYHLFTSKSLQGFGHHGTLNMNIPAFAKNAWGHGDLIAYKNQYRLYFQATQDRGKTFQIGLAYPKLK